MADFRQPLLKLRVARRITRRHVAFRCLIAAIALTSLMYVTGTTPSTSTFAGWETVGQWPSPAHLVDDDSATVANVLGHLLNEFRPSDTKPPWGEDRFDSKEWHWGDKASFTDKLDLKAGEVLKIRKAHRGFVEAIDKQLPKYIPGHSENLSAKRRGIVTVGGSKYFPVLLVSLRFLRRTGTSLPIEVFVLEDEYEPEVCRNVLPSYNAVCRVYPKLGGTSKLTQGFQLKVFALLFSSFDDVLFMDADNTAIRDVEPLFSSEAFTSTGLVTWPDYWQTTVSPLYYLITLQEAVPVSERQSTESGQLLVSKSRHWKSLLLAAYYNFYGPTFYYRLLNQGGTGMGDKETFLPAAEVFGLPFYNVRKPVDKVGHRFEDGSTGSRVQLQYDAADDYAVTQRLAESSNLSAAEWTSSYQSVRPLFLHLSWPKWDPTNLLGHVSKWSDMTIGVDGKPEPAFHYPIETAAQIKGTERMLWEEAMWVACHLKGVFRQWKANARADSSCEMLRNHFKTVLDTNVGIGMGLGPDDVSAPMMPDYSAV